MRVHDLTAELIRDRREMAGNLQNCAGIPAELFDEIDAAARLPGATFQVLLEQFGHRLDELIEEGF